MIGIWSFKDLFIYVFFIAGCRFSLVAVSRGYSLVMVSRLPIAVASLTVDQWL